MIPKQFNINFELRENLRLANPNPKSKCAKTTSKTNVEIATAEKSEGIFLMHNVTPKENSTYYP